MPETCLLMESRMILSKTQQLPHEFMFSGERYSVKWENGLKFMKEDEESSVFVSEDEFSRYGIILEVKVYFQYRQARKLLL